MNRIVESNKIKKMPKGCWLWLGSLNVKGYGQYRYKKNGKFTTMQLHRRVWMEERGPIPKGLVVAHHCDVRNCVNPEHLYVGTQAQNCQDVFDRKRRPLQSETQTHCLKGHEFTPENTGVRDPKKEDGGKRYCKACKKIRNDKYRSTPEGRARINARIKAWRKKKAISPSGKNNHI